jgi:hypothetical protein
MEAICRISFKKAVVVTYGRKSKNLKGAKSAPAKTIDGQSSLDNMACIFADKYQDLNNSEPYNVFKLSVIIVMN